jgi:hypothetical protein
LEADVAELLGGFFGWCWAHRTPLVVLVVIVALITPRPVQGQFIDWVPIIGAINAINTAITNVIGGALKAMNQTLGSISSIISAVQNLFQNVVYPQAAIARARGLVGQVMGIYNQIRAIAQTAVNSATLANPRTLEQTLLSRNPLQIPNVSANYQSVYQPLPPATDASPEMRNVIDMSDAAAQAAMKRAIAIDAIADQELRAAEQMLNELQAAAPGTAPMIGAQGSAWLVRAHAYTQAALADSMRLRAIDLANAGAEMKSNAGYGAKARGDMGTITKRR